MVVNLLHSGSYYIFYVLHIILIYEISLMMKAHTSLIKQFDMFVNFYVHEKSSFWMNFRGHFLVNSSGHFLMVATLLVSQFSGCGVQALARLSEHSSGQVSSVRLGGIVRLLLDNSVTLFITIKKKCPRKFTKNVHENSPKKCP